MGRSSFGCPHAVARHPVRRSCDRSRKRDRPATPDFWPSGTKVPPGPLFDILIQLPRPDQSGRGPDGGHRRVPSQPAARGPPASPRHPLVAPPSDSHLFGRRRGDSLPCIASWRRREALTFPHSASRLNKLNPVSRPALAEVISPLLVSPQQQSAPLNHFPFAVFALFAANPSPPSAPESNLLTLNLPGVAPSEVGSSFASARLEIDRQSPGLLGWRGFPTKTGPNKTESGKNCSSPANAEQISTAVRNNKI